MRFGLNTFLVNPGFTDADLELVRQFKEFGADVIELAIVEPDAIDTQPLLACLKENGLEHPAICGAFIPGRDLRGSEAEVKSAARYLEQLIQLAQNLESKVICGPLYSVTGRAERYSLEEKNRQLEQIAGALKPLCMRAEDAGIVLAVEPLNRFETDCVNTLSQAKRLIDHVGSPALKIHADTFHMHIEEDNSAQAILEAGVKYIGHVHASASHRGLLGKDQVDWLGVLGALKKIGYDGDIVIESFSEDNEVIARATSIWRTLYDSPEQLAVEGLRFLRENWQVISGTG